jgi:hypothetical protein
MQWPTATSTDQKSSGSAAYSTESGRHSGTTLTDAAKQWPTPYGLSSSNGPDGNEFSTAVRNWPSPRSEDSESCGNHPNATDSLTGAITLWSTPNVPNRGRESQASKDSRPNSGGIDLQTQVDNWGTPRSSDYKGSDDHGFMLGKGYLCAQAETNFSHQAQATHAGPPSCETTRTSPPPSARKRLNPAFTNFLMGAPVFWTVPYAIGSNMCSHGLGE